MSRTMDASRRERQEYLLKKNAEAGLVSAHMMLYSSEERRLIRQGFMVVRHGETKENHKSALYSTVYWKDAFLYGYSQLVLSYLNGEIKTFPPNLNFAQQLNLVSMKKNIKDGNQDLPFIKK